MKVDKKALSKQALASPSYLNVKDLTYKDAKKLASNLREEIIKAVSNNGGHLSSNLGSVEFTISLLRTFDAWKDDILFDTGHQSYTYKILTGRDIRKIRLDHGTAPFLDKKESEFDKVSTGHSSSSLSMAYGMEISKRINKIESRTVVVIGDGALESGIAYEAMDNIGADKKSRLILVMNDNGMSIQKARGALANWSNKARTSLFYGRGAEWFYEAFGRHRPTRWFYLFFKAVKDSIKRLLVGQNLFENLGFHYVGPVDGNDIRKVDLAFRRALLDKQGPVLIHLVTKKGKGYKPAEEDQKGNWHGVGPFDYLTAESEKKEEGPSYSKVLSQSVMKRMGEDEKTVVVDPAMVKGSNLDEVFKKYPDRTFDVGIAEEHAASFCGGVGLKGSHPILVIYSTFMQRAYDEIMEDIARQESSVLVLVERAGLAGGDGSSHHGIYDVAMVKSIPNCRVFMPFCKEQLEDIIERYSFCFKGPTFVRISKAECVEEKEWAFDLTKGIEIKEKGSGALALGIGPLGLKLLKGLSDVHIDTGMLADVLPGMDIRKRIAGYRQIYLYDPYGIEDGTASSLRDGFIDMGFKGKFVPFSLPKDFITFGTNGTILKDLGLDVESVKEKILNEVLSKPDATLDISCEGKEGKGC